ncbi:MAG: type II toxin-antitoxin system CcdA family antitoxin [Archaeoglobaceae archaeon]|nr:type II toxin-antitoxin system CcdA family antitoxin [Archaeoglobales archaeon]MDI9645702.1 type II toxin-antitoxin system CcdA family antitoxin [Archaeoglobales archaeon]
MNYITVSAKVKRELLEKARKLGINVSETIRRALEEEIKKREIEWAKKKIEEISSKSSLEKPSEELIREFRDKR